MSRRRTLVAALALVAVAVAAAALLVLRREVRLALQGPAPDSRALQLVALEKPRRPLETWAGPEVEAVAFPAGDLVTAGAGGVWHARRGDLTAGLPSRRAASFVLWAGEPVVALEAGGVAVERGGGWHELRSGWGLLHARALVEAPRRRAAGRRPRGALPRGRWCRARCERLDTRPVRALALGPGYRARRRRAGPAARRTRARRSRGDARSVDRVPGPGGRHGVRRQRRGAGARPARRPARAAAGRRGDRAGRLARRAVVGGHGSAARRAACDRGRRHAPRRGRTRDRPPRALGRGPAVRRRRGRPAAPRSRTAGTSWRRSTARCRPGRRTSRRSPASAAGCSPGFSTAVSSLADAKRRGALDVAGGAGNGMAWGVNALLVAGGELWRREPARRGPLRRPARCDRVAGPGAAFSLAATRDGVAIGYGQGVLLPGSTLLSAFHGLPGNQALALAEQDALYVGRRPASARSRAVACFGAPPAERVSSRTLGSRRCCREADGLLVGTWGGGLVRRAGAARRRADAGAGSRSPRRSGLQVSPGALATPDGRAWAGTDARGPLAADARRHALRARPRGAAVPARHRPAGRAGRPLGRHGPGRRAPADRGRRTSAAGGVSRMRVRAVPITLAILLLASPAPVRGTGRPARADRRPAAPTPRSSRCGT